MIMITNILAAITIAVVTNNVERSEQEFFGGWYPEGPMPTAEKVRFIRTTVKKQRLLNFSFEGKDFSEVVSEEILSDAEVKYRVSPQPPVWVPVGTNDIAWMNQSTITNNIGYGTNLMLFGETLMTNSFNITNVLK